MQQLMTKTDIELMSSPLKTQRLLFANFVLNTASQLRAAFHT